MNISGRELMKRSETALVRGGPVNVGVENVNVGPHPEGGSKIRKMQKKKRMNVQKTLKIHEKSGKNLSVSVENFCRNYRK